MTSEEIKRFAQKHTRDSFLLRDDLPDGWYTNGDGLQVYVKDGKIVTHQGPPVEG